MKENNQQKYSTKDFQKNGYNEQKICYCLI